MKEKDHLRIADSQEKGLNDAPAGELHRHQPTFCLSMTMDCGSES